jgi:outer membrane protein assembly factor BamB
MTDGPLIASPAVASGVVYIATFASLTDGKLYAFDARGRTHCGATPRKCRPLWTAATGAVFFSSPAVANGIVYVASWGGLRAGLYAYDAGGIKKCAGTPKICKSLWTQPLSAKPDPMQSSPSVVDGYVYVGTDNGAVLAYSLP